MDSSSKKPSTLLSEKFGNKIRIRVCGLCIEGSSVLLAKHTGMGPEELWLPPGGGLSFGEKAQSALKRELQEEAGIAVQACEFAFVYEVIRPPFHAIELFFHISQWSGTPSVGHDPELGEKQQIIQEVAFIPFEQIKHWPASHTHHLFRQAASIEELKALRGHYMFG